jgi:hypothetical protein
MAFPEWAHDCRGSDAGSFHTSQGAGILEHGTRGMAALI